MCWVQGDVLVACYVADVASKLQIHSLASGSKQRESEAARHWLSHPVCRQEGGQRVFLWLLQLH